MIWTKRERFNLPLEREFNDLKLWGEKNQIPLGSGVTPQAYLLLLVNKFEIKSKYINQFLNLYIDTRYKQIPLTIENQKYAKHLVKIITKN
jgi:hypothetical protein